MGIWINHRRLRWKVTVLEAALASCLCPGVSWYHHSVLFLNKWELFWNLDMERVGGSEVRGSVSVSGTNSVWWNLAVSHWAHEKQRCPGFSCQVLNLLHWPLASLEIMQNLLIYHASHSRLHSAEQTWDPCMLRPVRGSLLQLHKWRKQDLTSTYVKWKNVL